MINVDFIEKYGNLLRENVYGIQNVYHYDEHIYVIEEGEILGVFDAYVVIRDTPINSVVPEIDSGRKSWTKIWTKNILEAKIFCSEMDAFKHTEIFENRLFGKAYVCSYLEAKEIQHEIEFKTK